MHPGFNKVFYTLYFLHFVIKIAIIFYIDHTLGPHSGPLGYPRKYENRLTLKKHLTEIT